MVVHKSAPGGRKPPGQATAVKSSGNGFLANVPDEKRCKAIKRDGERCKKPAMAGLQVCRNHGGSFPNALAKSNAVKIEKAMNGKLARHGYGQRQIDENHVGANPVTGYLWELRRTAANIITAEEFLAQLDPLEITWGRTKDETKDSAISYSQSGDPIDGSYTMTVDEAKVHVWVTIYLAERKAYREMLKIGISAGLEERRIRLQETLVLQLNGAIANIAANLGADPNSPEVRRMIRDELIALERPEAAASEMEP